MSGVRPERPILPGSLIAVLRGGQLARMTALAARSMGYRIAVLDPDPNCAAAPVVDDVVEAQFDDIRAAQTALTGTGSEKEAPTNPAPRRPGLGRPERRAGRDLRRKGAVAKKLLRRGPFHAEEAVSVRGRPGAQNHFAGDLRMCVLDRSRGWGRPGAF